MNESSSSPANGSTGQPPRRSRAVRWLGDQIVDNPIFLRELRRRMRGRALFVGMMAYIAAMSVVAFIVISAHTVRMRTSGQVGMIDDMNALSENLFTWIAFIQGVLVLLVGPIITAGIATSEKEKKTLDFLQVTTLRPGMFIFGALASTMLYILLVLLCALPVLSITFLFGGVAPSDITASFGSLLLLSTIISAAALYIAALRERSRSAQSALLFVVGILVLVFLLLRVFTARMFSGGGGSALLPFSNLAPGGQVNVFGLSVQAWHADIIGALVIIGLFALLAGRRIFNPENRALSYWQGLVFFAGAELIIAAQLWGGNTTQADTVALAGIVTWALLVLFSLVYQTGRVEMGNEVWRLKRRFRFLRGIDEALVHQLALIGIWAIIGGWWVSNTAAAQASPAQTTLMWHRTLIFVAAAALFTGAIARVFANLMPTRGLALRWTFVAAVGIYVVIPLLLMMLVTFGSGVDARKLAALDTTPWVYLTRLAGEDLWDPNPVFDFDSTIRPVTPIVYLIGAAVLYTLALGLHRRRWARPDYCVAERPERRISEEPFISPRIHQELRASAAASSD